MAVSGVSDTIGELKVKLAAELDNSTLEKLLTICDVKPAQKEEIKQSDHRYLAFLNYFQQTTTEDNEFVDELEKMFNKVERRRPAHMVALFKASIHRKRVMFETQSEYSAGHNDCEDDDDEYFSLDETVPTKYRPEYSKDHTICEDDHHDHDEDKDEEYFSSDETVHPKYRSGAGAVILPITAAIVVPLTFAAVICLVINIKQAKNLTPEADETTKQHQSENYYSSAKIDMSVNDVNKTVDFETSDPSNSNYAYETVISSQSDVQNVNNFYYENKYFPLDGTQVMQENESEYLTIR